MSLELADAVLFLDAEPLAAALVGAGIVQFDHFTLVVAIGASAFFEGFLEADSALYTFQVEGCPGQMEWSLACGQGSGCRVVKPHSMTVVLQHLSLISSLMS